MVESPIITHNEFNVTIPCVEATSTPLCHPISFSGFNLSIAFGTTPLDPCTSTTRSIGTTYNLVVNTFVFGLDISTCCFRLFLLCTSSRNNPLRVLNLHIRTSTWFPFLGVPLFKSCFASISDHVLSLKGSG